MSDQETKDSTTQEAVAAPAPQPTEEAPKLPEELLDTPEQEKELEYQDSSDFRYRVIERKENAGESVILKEGIVEKFTLNTIINDLNIVAKKKAELDSMAKIEEAKMANITNTNPEIAEIDENLMKVYFIFQRARSVSGESRKKIKEYEVVEKQLRTELANVMIQTGIQAQPADESTPVA